MFEFKFIKHSIKKTLIIFLIGFCVYPAIEIIWNTIFNPMGYKIFAGLFSMGLLGGFLLIILGNINEIKFIREKCPVFVQSIIGGALITLLEFFTGLIVNKWLNWNVWNYSSMPFNVAGQVCLLYSIFWTLLTPLAFWVDDIFRKAYNLLIGLPIKDAYLISVKHRTVNVKIGTPLDLALRYRNFFKKQARL